MTLSFNPGSRRVIKAKLATSAGQGARLLVFILAALSLAAMLWLGVIGSHFWMTAAGVFLASSIVAVWLKYGAYNPITSTMDGDHIALDEIMESDLLANFFWPASSQQLWKIATAGWQGRFIVNHLFLHEDSVLLGLSSDASSGEAVMQQAVELSRKSGWGSINGATVVAALLLSSQSLADYLTELKLDAQDVVEAAAWQRRIKERLIIEQRHDYFGGFARDWASGYTPVLNRFGRNLSNEIERGQIRQIALAHPGLVEQVESELSRQQRSSVALVGKPGSGKSSLAYLLAERMIKGQSPQALRYKQVVALDASRLISSGVPLEELVLNLFTEAVLAGNIVLLLDEAQLFFGEGTGAVDLSNILLPILQQNRLRTILAMTPNDWQGLSLSNPALVGLLNQVAVPDAGRDEVMVILEHRAAELENSSHILAVTLNALKAAYELSGRYLPEESYPGKAIKVLEDALPFAESGLVDDEAVKTGIERSRGVKIASAGRAEKEQLLNLEDAIHQRMVNQTRAVKVVSDALRRARAGVRNQNRPVGSFLFLGPTGVGKTELSKALAAVYFGDEKRMVRIDMSEYQRPEDAARLLSPAASGTGVSFLPEVRQNPASLVLFDEIEKAHPDILNLFLQLLDEGQLTDSAGRAVSFKDAIIIATSNAGSDEIRERVGKGEDMAQFEKELVDRLIDSHQFRQEFLNRFDDIVLFRPLAKEELRHVATLMLDQVNASLASQKLSVKVDDAGLDWLVEQGFDPRLGARPMRRAIQKAVESSVAKQILAGETRPGQVIELTKEQLAQTA